MTRVTASVDQVTVDFLTKRQTFMDRLLEVGPEQGLQRAQQLSHHTDTWFLALCHLSFDANILNRCMIYALGGYGREQLCFYSDLDVLIEVHDTTLLKDPIFEHGVERLMQRVRQARLKLSHAVRDVAQGELELMGDPRTPIALLDARLLFRGQDVQPNRSVNASRACSFLRADEAGTEFVTQLVQSHLQRRQRHDQTVYLLEPDLKSGAGGLRDLNTVMWAAHVRWPEPQHVIWDGHVQNDYDAHLSWLLWLRNHLHRQHGRKNDRLRFHDQEHIAPFISDEQTNTARPVEQLMQRHYQHTRSALHIMERYLRQWSVQEEPPMAPLTDTFGHIWGQLGALTSLSTAQFFEAFDLAQTHDLLLHPRFEQQALETVALWQTLPRDEQPKNDPAHQRTFYALLTHVHAGQRTTQRLLDLGILAHMMPEFGPIVCHVQHDLYHVYTTDQHTIYCTEMARTLCHGAPNDLKWPAFLNIARQIKSPDLLILAALTHDIGKNRGGQHSRRGAQMAPGIGTRLGLSAQRCEELAFLIREHLALSKTARRHDISDTRVIRKLAHTIKTVETLNILTVLTFCDMSTVGPTVMNDWNAVLLLTLYQRIKTSIEHGIEHLWRQFKDKRQHQREVLKGYIGHTDQKDQQNTLDKLDAFLRTITTEMIATVTPETLWQLFQTYQICIEQQRPAQHVIFEPTMGVTQWIIVTRDEPGTLTRIAGALSACGLDILTADLTSTASGYALDMFRVLPQTNALMQSNAQHGPLTQNKIDRVMETMTRVLNAEEDVMRLLEQRKKADLLLTRHTPSITTSIQVDQALSEDCTVLEIVATDRPGLLHDIAHTLHQFEINTLFSKIDSPGNTIIDTFYVEDAHGMKLNEETVKALILALKLAIDAPKKI